MTATSEGPDAGLVPLLGHGPGSCSLAKGCWQQKPIGGPGGCLGSNSYTLIVTSDHVVSGFLAALTHHASKRRLSDTMQFESVEVIFDIAGLCQIYAVYAPHFWQVVVVSVYTWHEETYCSGSHSVCWGCIPCQSLRPGLD